MKTLVNKNNQQIRITAPEIVLSANKEQYWIAGIPQIPRTYLAKEWTLVEEESKHTEVWSEGRTIFEQEGEPTEDWKEKRKKECPFRRNLDNNLHGCERYADEVCACDGNCSWVVDYPKLKEIQDKRAETRKEQKPEEWSKEDEEHLKSIISTIEKVQNGEDESAANVLGYYDSDIAWLELLPERFNLQPKNEQSEEDYHWEGLVRLLRGYQKTIDGSSNNLAYECVESYIDWIKEQTKK